MADRQKNFRIAKQMKKGKKDVQGSKFMKEENGKNQSRRGRRA